jgi:hypothetical protein
VNRVRTCQKSCVLNVFLEVTPSSRFLLLTPVCRARLPLSSTFARLGVCASRYLDPPDGVAGELGRDGFATGTGCGRAWWSTIRCATARSSSSGGSTRARCSSAPSACRRSSTGTRSRRRRALVAGSRIVRHTRMHAHLVCSSTGRSRMTVASRAARSCSRTQSSSASSRQRRRGRRPSRSGTVSSAWCACCSARATCS